MKLIRGLNNLRHQIKSSVVTIGNFDGMHLGHQALIRELVKKSQSVNVPSVVITFEPQPNEFFSQQSPVSRLNRFREKWTSIKKFGVDYVLCIRFNKKFAAISAEDFVEKILVERLGIKAIIIGDDFRFGAKRKGDFNLLQKMGEQYNFETIKMSSFLLQEKRVSSTEVRNALAKSDFKLTHQLLGRPYELIGKVAHGEKRGRGMGYPTANINLHRKQVPITGIFAVRIKGINHQIYYGVAYIGIRSVFNGTRVILEVHIFDFDQTIYGRNLQIEFLKKIRDDAHFDSVDALIAQIEKDAEAAKQFIQSHYQ